MDRPTWWLIGRVTRDKNFPSDNLFALFPMTKGTVFMKWTRRFHVNFISRWISLTPNPRSIYHSHLPCPLTQRFLDATTHLYNRLCPFVGPSIRLFRVNFERQIWVEIHQRHFTQRFIEWWWSSRIWCTSVVLVFSGSTSSFFFFLLF